MPNDTTTTLAAEVERLAAKTGFSGVVRVDRGATTVLSVAHGMADRRWAIPNTVNTRFGMASVAKGFTALVVASLIEDGTLTWSTTARSLLGPDLPLVDDAVTVKHLIAHRSGIGDYLDENVPLDITDYLLTAPAQELANAEQYRRVLDGIPSKFAPGERFSYCNSGFVLLALLAERASGAAYHDLVRTRVCEPAGMHDTEFLRSDDLPGDVALGYVPIDGTWRTNVFHLPVRGVGDGGIFSTVDDLHLLWRAFFDRRIVGADMVANMIRPRSNSPDGRRYGLGFWLKPSGAAVQLEGWDAGVSCYSTHNPAHQLTHTVVSNTSHGAEPVNDLLDELLAGRVAAHTT
jgi:CubicO group peptidase (beta-lactamase class C family)